MEFSIFCAVGVRGSYDAGVRPRLDWPNPL